ncbi:hypothetical protein DVH24_042003 [Malus domestica]|uniref:RNase H type-1 domain-containing protein n=1 Tax=Malus domestica TaxID=3750 RepID=A0A498ISU5_MALDO|nr:hypothetical protein DVH24_042003 [Malus domestica]
MEHVSLNFKPKDGGRVELDRGKGLDSEGSFHSLANIIDQCEQLMIRIAECELVHVYREKNMVANEFPIGAIIWILSTIILIIFLIGLELDYLMI